MPSSDLLSWSSSNKILKGERALAKVHIQLFKLHNWKVHIIYFHIYFIYTYRRTYIYIYSCTYKYIYKYTYYIYMHLPISSSCTTWKPGRSMGEDSQVFRLKWSSLYSKRGSAEISSKVGPCFSILVHCPRVSTSYT